jgi:hypothetical protein
LYLSQTAHRKATWWLAAIVGVAALLLAMPAIGHAEETNPNDDNCVGYVSAGPPEPGSEEQQVQYTFNCSSQITGYQLQSQIPVTGIGGQPPLVTSFPANTPLTDTFSCAGEAPGYAINCVGLTKAAYEQVTGQFAIGTPLCKEPRVDPLLTVVFASAAVEKGATVVTQAISGPFDLGRPRGCKPDAESGGTRLEPKEVVVHKKHKKKGKKSAKKSDRKK